MTGVHTQLTAAEVPARCLAYRLRRPVTSFPDVVTLKDWSWDSYLISLFVTREGRQGSDSSVPFISRSSPKVSLKLLLKNDLLVKLALSSLSVLYTYKPMSSPESRCKGTSRSKKLRTGFSKRLQKKATFFSRHFDL